jgi:putative Holliday junction resolvase
VARILGIDLGERRIGIAISTPEGGLAVPLRILDAQGDRSDAQAIYEIAQPEGVERVVLGHPISMDGTTGPQAQRVEEFAQTLREVTGLPVDLQDERLSTAQARRSVKRKGETREPVDDIAAAVILQSYLDGLSGRVSES